MDKREGPPEEDEVEGDKPTSSKNEVEETDAVA